MDAKARFFAAMDLEYSESERTRGENVDIDFSITESGRTVAHMVTDTQRSLDDMDLSIAASMRSNVAAGDNFMMGFTESEREGIVEAFGPGSSEISKPQLASLPPPSSQRNKEKDLAMAARSIPVPRQQVSSLLAQQSHNQHPNHPPSQGSSYGSSGSNFLSSVLNPQASTFGNTHLSHTPPAASSYEVSHFGKRARSGSVSGRLRSAADYFEQRGLLDRQTMGILKDLLIIGDEELQRGLDLYEAGDPSILEDMISSGALQNRLPEDIDIMGDLDLDFLTVHDDTIGPEGLNVDMNPDGETLPPGSTSYSHPIPVQPSGTAPGRASHQNFQHYQYDDGIGELDFGGDFASEFGMQQPQSFGSSRQPSVAASPAELHQMSEYERRMRSNSLFSALINEPGSSSLQSNDTNNTVSRHHGQWTTINSTAEAQGINIGARQSGTRPITQSALAVEMNEAEKKRKGKKEKKIPKEAKKKEKDEDEMKEEHIPGSGRPRSLSDPNLRATVDSFGLMSVDRPDGWVGAYSPDSRKVRIGRFLEKRNHRVWIKTVKYDVRKNFADSRLRVKGRFVKKEDELLMRELMSLT